MIPPLLTEALRPNGDAMLLLPLEKLKSVRLESKLLPMTLPLLAPGRLLRLLLLPPERPLPSLSIQKERGQV